MLFHFVGEKVLDKIYYFRRGVFWWVAIGMVNVIIVICFSILDFVLFIVLTFNVLFNVSALVEIIF